MRGIDRLFFLIHGFCYAAITGATEVEQCEKFAPYLARENRCAALWRQRLDSLTEADALVAIPLPGPQPPDAVEYYNAARDNLGDRFFYVDCPDCFEAKFWDHDDTNFQTAILKELRSACTGQGAQWNKEELQTTLHTLACSHSLQTLLDERGLSFNAATVRAEGWGASFEGCVTKYTLNLRHFLSLGNPIGVDFTATVPDAAFLLEIDTAETISLNNGLRLDFFRTGEKSLALISATKHSLGDVPVCVALGSSLANATVLSKQGIRLWPDPELYILNGVPDGYQEQPQQVVRMQNGKLQVPVSTGVVYRLAKAPAYIVCPRGMRQDDFHAALCQTTLA